MKPVTEVHDATSSLCPAFDFTKVLFVFSFWVEIFAFPI